MSDAPVLKPCGHCGEQCADLIIDQGDKWAHYSASCLEVRTGYDLSNDAPWRVEAIAAYNKRQPTPSDDLREALSEAWLEYFEAKAELAELERNRDTTRRFDRALDKQFDAEEKARRTLAALQEQANG